MTVSMRRTKLFSLLISLCGLLIAAPAWAITDKVQGLSPGLFTVIFWGLVGIAALFVVLFIVKVLAAKRQQRKFSEQTEQLDLVQARIDSLNTGVVLYSDD